MNEAVARIEERRAPLRFCIVRGCGRVVQKFGAEMCRECTEMDQQLNQYWEKRQKRAVDDPEFYARQAARDAILRRFIAVLLFMLAGEGLLSYAFGLSFTWAWLMVDLGWALLIAALAGWFGARR